MALPCLGPSFTSSSFKFQFNFPLIFMEYFANLYIYIYIKHVKFVAEFYH